jgi:hypothetical protein
MTRPQAIALAALIACAALLIMLRAAGITP